MKSIYKVLFISILSICSLYAGQGLHQKHLVGISPSSAEVTSKSSFVFTFDKPILKTSVKKYSVILKQKKPQRQKIPTQISVLNNKLMVSLASPLEKGIYVLKLKPLKLTKDGDNKLQVKTSWQKFIAWICGLFYKDVSKCPLCQYFCYTSNVIKTKPIKFRFEIKEEMVKVISLETNTSLVELSEHNSTNISVIATYDDNSTEDVTQKATYSSSDSSVDVDKGLITSNTEGSSTVTISYGDKSISVQVEVYEMIDGHLLPHEPENPDDTLLGVDDNNNSVRDEVERWIYKEMPTYHHPEIERVIAMQRAKAYQLALSNQSNLDSNVSKTITKSIECWFYYSYSRALPFDASVQKFNNNIKDKLFNTKQRLNAYIQYDRTLAGTITTATPTYMLNANYCEKNIDILP